MSLVVDYAGRISPAALRAAGVTGVVRYLSWWNRYGGRAQAVVNPKVILQPEYEQLLAGGVEVTLNWEYDSHDWLSGHGAEHAQEAVRQARRLGYPQGCTIIGSCDFDITREQWLAGGRAYANQFARAIGAAGYRPGVYGPSDVLQWCADEHILGVFWQAGMSIAYSQGRNRHRWDGAQLRQLGRTTIAGVTADISEILVPFWGQATSTGGTVSTPTGYPPINPQYVYDRLDAILAEEQPTAEAVQAVRTELDTLLATVTSGPRPAVDAGELAAALASDSSFINALAAALAGHIRVS
jgi:hypothetical protein